MALDNERKVLYFHRNARTLKENGSKYFKEKHYDLALSNYLSAVELYDTCSKIEIHKSLPMGEKQIIRANIAQVYLSQEKYKDCIASCQKLLLEDECDDNVTLDSKIREKTKYRLGKAMGLINDNYDFISDLGDRNLKIEPNQWNLFPACWSSNKSRSDCLKFDRGLAKNSYENENLIVILHGLGDSPESFYDLPQKWKLEKTAYLFVSGCEDISLDLSSPGDIQSNHAFSWFDYFNQDTYEWYDEFASEPLKKCTINIEKYIDKLIRIHLVKECGWRLDQIFLFGFSQGGTIALEYLLWLNDNIKQAAMGGIIGISTQLLGARRKLIQDYSEQNSTKNMYSIKTPILLIHGEKDTKLLPKYNIDSADCLKRLINLEYPYSGVTHKIFQNRGHVMLRGGNRDEMKLFYDFMANNLNGVGKKKEEAAMKELVRTEGLIPLK